MNLPSQLLSLTISSQNHVKERIKKVIGHTAKLITGKIASHIITLHLLSSFLLLKTLTTIIKKIAITTDKRLIILISINKALKKEKAIMS